MTTKFIFLICIFAVTQARFTNIDRPIDNFRIIGGSDAEPGEFPHMVSLRWGIPLLASFKHVCAGSIIDKRWILTAAHCIKAYEHHPWYGMSFVLAGRYDLRSSQWNGQWSFMESHFVHEKYSERSGASSPYDIALIKLSSPLEFNKFVAPIRLPKKNSEPTGPVTLSGWGTISSSLEKIVMPRILQRADLDILDRAQCSQDVVKTYKMISGQIKGNLIDDTNICTDASTAGLSGCNGDSGGALIKKDDNGQTEIVGIVSWRVKPCGLQGSPDVYTKVSAFIDWINNIISNN